MTDRKRCTSTELDTSEAVVEVTEQTVINHDHLLHHFLDRQQITSSYGLTISYHILSPCMIKVHSTFYH